MTSSSPSPAPPRSPWFTLGNVTLLRYLYQFKPPPGVSMTEQAVRCFRHFRLGRQLFYSNILLHLLRICYLNYHLATGGSLVEQQPYAPLYTFFIELYHVFTGLKILIVGTCGFILALGFDYLICFRSDHHNLKLAYELVVSNGEELLSLNRHRLGERPRFCWRAPLHFLQQWSRLIECMWNSNNLRFKQSKLEQLPNISSQLRARLAVYSTAIGYMFSGLCRLSVLIQVAFAIFYSTTAHHRLPPSTWLLFGVDLLFIDYCIANSLRVASFAVHFGFLATIFMHHHLHQLNHELQNALALSHLSLFRYRYLHFFYREYTHFKKLTEHLNTQIVSPMMALLFLNITCISILFISHLLFVSTPLNEQLAICSVLVFMVPIPLFACLTLITWAKSFYSSERLLFQAQLMLTYHQQRLFYRASLLSAKVKLLIFYEQICTKRRFYFSVGPFGHISKRALYEFSYAYSAMVMYVSRMIREAQME